MGSTWLFQKTLFYNGSKVTWKQLRGYLKKSEAVREDVRDIFADKERARNYDEHKAEIIAEMSKNVEKNKSNLIEGASQTETLMDLMRAIKSQNDEMKQQNQEMRKEINDLKQRLLDEDAGPYQE